VNNKQSCRNSPTAICPQNGTDVILDPVTNRIADNPVMIEIVLNPEINNVTDHTVEKETDPITIVDPHRMIRDPEHPKIEIIRQTADLMIIIEIFVLIADLTTEIDHNTTIIDNEDLNLDINPETDLMEDTQDLTHPDHSIEIMDQSHTVHSDFQVIDRNSVFLFLNVP
jgi:hypothetical protein